MSRPSSQAERLQAFLHQAARVAQNEPLDPETWAKLRIVALEQGLPDGTWEDQVKAGIGLGEVGQEPTGQPYAGQDVTWLEPSPPIDEGIEFTSAPKPPHRPSRRPPLPPPPPRETTSPSPPPPPPDSSFNEIQPLDLNAEDIQFVEAAPVENERAAHQPPPPPGGYADATPTDLDEVKSAGAKSKPPRKKRKPAESFESYVNKALSLMSTPVLTRKKEEKLATEGRGKLALSDTLARWIIHDVAAQRGVPVLSLQEAEEEGTDQAQESARLESFLERVAPILAEQRGVNARSRMLMEAVSQEMGLSRREFEKSMELLQGGGKAQASHEIGKEQVDLREADYREFLNTTLPKMPRGIVTATQERDLSAAGVDRFGVAASRASQLIRDACGELDLRYISPEQATQHIADLIDEKLASSSWLSTTVSQRIVAEGEQWGLMEDQVLNLIGAAQEVQRRQTRKSRQVAIAAMGAVAVLVFAVIGGGAWIAWQSGDKLDRQELASGETPRPSQALSTDGIENPATPEAPDPGWLRDLELSISSARIVWADARPHLTKMHDGVSLERDEAYQSLIRLGEEENRANRRDLLTDILAGAYALDPVEANATRMRERFAASLRGEAPFEDQRVEQLFWVLEVAVAAMTRNDSPESRSASLARLLSDVLGTVVDPNASAVDLESQCASALCRQLYRKLGKAVTLPPKKFARAMDALANVAHRHLDENEFERLEVQLLTDAIQGSASRWEELEPQLRRRAASDNSNTILKLVELLERSGDNELKDFLGLLFEGRSDLVRTPVTTDTVADEVRKNLGVPRETTYDDRWIQFDRLSQDALDNADESKQPATVLRQTVQLAHAASAGRSLAHHELAASSFDELISDGAPKIETIGSGVSGGRRPARTTPPPTMRFGAPGVKNRLDQIFQSLRGSSRIPSRLNFLRLLASTAASIEQLSPTYCYQLGEYLASPKQRLEHQQMMEFVPQFRRWKHLRLALADEVLAASAKDPQLDEVVSSVAQQSFPQTDVDDWKRAVRRSLLKSVIAQTSSGGAAEIRDLSAIDRAAKVLKNIYAERARVLGAPADQADSATSASQALGLIVERLAHRLSGKRQTPDVKAILSRLPHERAALDFAADNDLVRLVMLQRLAIRLITLEVMQQREDRIAAIQDNLQQLVAYDHSATNVLEQLREGESRMVKLWRIVNEP